MRRITVLFLLLGLAATGYARQPDLRFEHPINTRAYNISMTQDREGFLWLGSTGGLMRYDGYGLKVYKPGPGSVSATELPSILVDSAGLIWIASVASGVNLYDKESDTFTVYRHDPDNPASIGSNLFNWAPQTLAEDREGQLWMGTQEGLNSFDKKTGIFTRFQHDPDDPASLSDNNIWVVHAGSDGRIWIGTEKGGLNCYDKKTASFTHYRHDPTDAASLSDDFVYAIAEDQNNVLWIGTKAGGLNRLDQRSGTFTHYRHDPDDPKSLAHDEVFFILADRENNLWLGRSFSTAVGLEKLDTKTMAFQNFRHNPDDPGSLSGDIVLSVFEDRTGTLWVPENLGGVNKYDKHAGRFRVYVNDPHNGGSISHSTVQAVTEDREGTLWIGTAGGLNRYAPDTGTFTSYQNGEDTPGALPHNDVSSVMEDGSGELWVGNIDGSLSRFEKATGKVMETFRGDVALFGVWGLQEDRTNPETLWFGTETHGIASFNKTTGKFRLFGHDPDRPDSLGASMVRNLFQDQEGGLWVPTMGGGLEQYIRNSGTFRHYRHDPGDPQSISGNIVNDIYADSRGRFWVSTDSGLNRFHKSSGTFTRFGPESGFSTHSIITVREDRKGYLWVSSDTGLFKFDPQRGQVVKFYTDDDGVKYNQKWPTSAFASKDGMMWFAGIDGISRFFPEAFTDNPHIPPIVVTALKQGGVDMDPGMATEKITALKLNWPNNFFEFEFAALNYTLPAKNRYQYYLAGHDPDWYFAGARRFGRYAGLSPGKYTLKIKGSNNDGVWNEVGTAIDILVVPVWWQAGWFWMTAAMATTGLLFGVFIWRVNAVRLQRERLERMVRERTRALSRSEERFRGLSESTFEGIVIHDEGRILEVNQATLDLLGTTRNEMIGRYGTEFVDEASGKVITEKIREQFLEPYEVTGLRKDGTTFPMEVHSKMIPYRDKRVRVTAMRDITSRKQVEENLHRAKEASESANRAKSEFLANMSHELRTPLNAVLGFSEILREMEEDGKKSHFLQSIQTSGNTLLSLINDILDLSKIEAGKEDLKYSPISMGAFIKEIAQIFSHGARKKNIEFITVVDPGLPDTLLLDETRFRQITINLLGNALKFTEKGFISLSISGGFTRGSAKGRCDLSITVKDTGMGIPERDLETIFESFQQGVATRTSPKIGTGLGLTITRRLVEMMSGTITASSQEGKGSTFRITLPNIAVGDPSAPPKPPPPHLDYRTISFEPATILIADDIDDNREILALYLEKFGFDLLHAQNGQKAIEQANATGCDLILLDMKMPVMDGYEAAERFKADEALRDIPLVAVTASALKQDEDRISSLCNGYLRKPVEKNELVRELMRFLPYSTTTNPEIQEAGPPAISDAAIRAQLKKLSPETTAALVDAVRTCHLAGIKEVLKNIGQAGSPAAERLAALADQFDYDAILDLIAPDEKAP